MCDRAFTRLLAQLDLEAAALGALAEPEQSEQRKACADQEEDAEGPRTRWPQDFFESPSFGASVRKPSLSQFELLFSFHHFVHSWTSLID